MIPQPLLHGIVFICSILIFLIPDIAEASEPEKYTLKAEECRQGDLLRWNGRDGLRLSSTPGSCCILKFKGEKTVVIIGDNTTLRECVTVNRGTASKGQTVIGRNCLIMAYSHIAHDCVLKDNVIIGNASQIAGEVEIDDFAIVSGGSLVHQFTRISKHVMVQGGSRIGKDIPPYTLIGRDPIVYCGINIVGLRRRGFTNQQVYLIQDIYRTLYTRGLNNSDALKAIETEYEPCEERDLILNFIKSSKRGIVRGSIDEL